MRVLLLLLLSLPPAAAPAEEPQFSVTGSLYQILPIDPPLGLLLNGSSFYAGDGWNGSYFDIGDSSLISIVAITATQLPEPAAFGLIALAFAGVGLRTRRRSGPCFPTHSLCQARKGEFACD